MNLTDDQKLGIFCMFSFSVFFVLLMQFHLMAGVITGLLTYTLTVKLDDFIAKRLKTLNNNSKLISVLLLSLLIIIIFIGGFWYLFSWFISIAKNPNDTITNIQNIVDQISLTLPESIRNLLPENVDSIKDGIITYTKDHISSFQLIVKDIFHILIVLIVGMIIGLILGFKENKRVLELNKKEKPTKLIKALKDCLDRLVLVFQYVAISQVVIALFNATMTAILLFVVMPIFGVHIPFSKSLVLATFVFGLIPIIGNLIINIIMCIVAFTISFGVSIVVLIYLILIHKVEYILNAKIVGTKINAGICELLIAMFFLETIFGIIGLVFAPIFYAFIKLSLKQLKLI